MKKYNIGISVILILLSALMIRSSLQSGAAVQGTAMGPGVWPMILSVAMILLSVILIIQTLVRPRPEGEEKPIDFRSTGMKRIYILIGLLALFCLLLKLFGFYVAIIYLSPSVMFLLGERRPLVLIGLTAGIVVFIVIVFVVLLQLKMPGGILLSF